jgi:signal transduction histidine kinase
LRLRQSAREEERPAPTVAHPGAATDLMRLALGTAHELNNPLMAVVVAAELAVARGGAEAPLRALQQAAHDVAAVVRRLQGLAAGRNAEAPVGP